MLRATFLVALVLCAPSYAQSADAPIAVLDRTQLADAPCKKGDVVLTAEEAVKVGKKLAAAEAKVEVYEKNPPLPWWGVVILAVVAAGAGVGVTVAVYEAGKRP